MTSLMDARRVVDEIWEALPLTAAETAFVTERAPVFGATSIRQNSAFRRGEPLLTYIEPVGYIRKAARGGFWAFGVSLDFEILTPEGQVLGGQKGFLSYEMSSKAKVKELMLNATLTLDGIPDGAYVLHYTLRDLNSPKIAEVSLPFTITA